MKDKSIENLQNEAGLFTFSCGLNVSKMSGPFEMFIRQYTKLANICYNIKKHNACGMWL